MTIQNTTYPIDFNRTWGYTPKYRKHVHIHIGQYQENFLATSLIDLITDINTNISYHIISHHITSHHITPHHTTPHHITSHHIICPSLSGWSCFYCTCMTFLCTGVICFIIGRYPTQDCRKTWIWWTGLPRARVGEGNLVETDWTHRLIQQRIGWVMSVIRKNIYIYMYMSHLTHSSNEIK